MIHSIYRAILGLLLIALVCSCAPKPPSITSVSGGDPIFFEEIDRVTDIAGIDRLRMIYVPSGDLELRVWRGFGLFPLEGVVLRRTNGSWSGLHLAADDYIEAGKVRVDTLQRPRSGWMAFATKVIEDGLLGLPKTTEEDCDRNVLDGIGYVVEINQNRTYRNYYYRDGNIGCRESEEMSNIGEIIGIEFDKGTDRCKTAEWFPCVTYRKLREQKELENSKTRNE